MAGIDVDYEQLGRNRQVEADNIAEEISVVGEYKFAFDTELLLYLMVKLNTNSSVLKIVGENQLILTQLCLGLQKRMKFKK